MPFQFIGWHTIDECLRVSLSDSPDNGVVFIAGNNGIDNFTLAVFMGTFTVNDGGTMYRCIINKLRNLFGFIRYDEQCLLLILFVEHMQYLS